MTIAHAYTLLLEAAVLAASFGILWLSFWVRDRHGVKLGSLVLARGASGGSLAIKLESPAPVLDGETTIGIGGRRFQMLKFRTTARGPQQGAAPWTQTPTRVGLFLQQTRIEQLPQLINVLRGEMRLTDSDLFD